MSPPGNRRQFGMAAGRHPRRKQSRLDRGPFQWGRNCHAGNSGPTARRNTNIHLKTKESVAVTGEIILHVSARGLIKHTPGTADDPGRASKSDQQRKRRLRRRTKWPLGNMYRRRRQQYPTQMKSRPDRRIQRCRPSVRHSTTDRCSHSSILRRKPSGWPAMCPQGKKIRHCTATRELCVECDHSLDRPPGRMCHRRRWTVFAAF